MAEGEGRLGHPDKLDRLERGGGQRQRPGIGQADVLGGEVVPIDSVGGALPRSYSRVLTNLTVRH